LPRTEKAADGGGPVAARPHAAAQLDSRLRERLLVRGGQFGVVRVAGRLGVETHWAGLGVSASGRRLGVYGTIDRLAVMGTVPSRTRRRLAMRVVLARPEGFEHAPPTFVIDGVTSW